MIPENWALRKKKKHNTVTILELNNTIPLIQSSVDELNTRKNRAKEMNSELENRPIENT